VPLGPGPLVVGPGSCLATWRPDLLDARLIPRPDIVVDAGTGVTSGQAGPPARATFTTEQRQRSFTVGERQFGHVRHQHKYAEAALPPAHWFYFHADAAEARATAGSLEEFVAHLGHADPATVAYHAGRGDFSRWVSGVLADQDLASELAAIEDEFTTRSAAAVEAARDRIRRAVRRRYFRPA
jgi:hypothetical protein